MNFTGLIQHSVSAVVTITCLTIPQSASAQVGFGRVPDTPYGGGVTIINNMKSQTPANTKVKLEGSTVSQAMNPASKGPSVPVPPRIVSINLAPALTQTWDNMRVQITSDALAFLNEHDIGGGFRTSRNRLDLDKEGSLFVGWDARGLTLKFVLKDNFLSTYLRTPTPLDRDTDPGFIVNFDLDVLIDVDIQNNQLVAGPARIVPHVKPPVGKNVTGAFAVAAADLVKTLTGVDFVGKFLYRINSREFGFDTPLNRELAKLNPVLQTASNGGTIVPGFNGGTGYVTLTLQRTGPAPVVH
ncbi:MAG TPA: hypothetical protein VF042_12890 [Gemmatimonadaceae bacterium]